jgi:transglutaminase-like putative cysteine protease
MRKILPILLGIVVTLGIATVLLLPAQIDASESRAQIPAAAALPISENTEPALPRQSAPLVDTHTAGDGYVSVTYYEPEGKYKVLIEKDSERYVYDLVADNSTQAFPLQMGDGAYTVSVMENIGGNQYAYLTNDTVTVDTDDLAVYLAPVQMVKWQGLSEAAAVLTEGFTTDREKVEAIYDYVVTHIIYDDDKIDELAPGYIPDPIETLRKGDGICYDFASLTASLCRASGIPARLVKGYADTVNGYHAWNEIYCDGAWITVDTSYDAQMYGMGNPYEIEKAEGIYEAEKIY